MELAQLQAELGAKRASFLSYLNGDEIKSEIARDPSRARELVEQKKAELEDFGEKVENHRQTQELIQKSIADISKWNNPSGSNPAVANLSKNQQANPFDSFDLNLGQQNPNQLKSIGELFLDSEGFKHYNKSDRKGPEVKLDTKSVFTTAGSTPNYAPEILRMPGIMVDYKLRQPMMDSVIPVLRTTQPSITYMEELAPVNGTGWVEPNDPRKKESRLTYTQKTVPIGKLRESMPLTEETIEDVPYLMDMINTRLMNLFNLKKDDSILSGSGVAPEILGLLNTSGIQTQALGGDPITDAIFKAMTKVQVNNFLYPNAVVMHPNDWAKIRLLRTSEGMYIYGGPNEEGPSRLWGLRIISTTGITQGTALVGAFDTSCAQVIRKDVHMSISTEHEDYWMRGILGIKLEMRMGLVVYRPAGLCTVTGI